MEVGGVLGEELGLLAGLGLGTAYVLKRGARKRGLYEKAVEVSVAAIVSISLGSAAPGSATGYFM